MMKRGGREDNEVNRRDVPLKVVVRGIRRTREVTWTGRIKEVSAENWNEGKEVERKRELDISYSHCESATRVLIPTICWH